MKTPSSVLEGLLEGLRDGEAVTFAADFSSEVDERGAWAREDLRRLFMLADFAVRIAAPRRLDTIHLDGLARSLRELNPVLETDAAFEAHPAADALRPGAHESTDHGDLVMHLRVLTEDLLWAVGAVAASEKRPHLFSQLAMNEVRAHCFSSPLDLNYSESAAWNAGCGIAAVLACAPDFEAPARELLARLSQLP